MLLSDIFTPKNVTDVAQEIVHIFVSQANADTLEVDFKLKNGRMEINYTDNKELKEALISIHDELVPQPNTNFSFNAPPNSIIWKMKDLFCSKLNKDELTDADYLQIQDFIKKVINAINNDSQLLEKIENTVRKHNGAEKHLFPFKNTKVVLFEFGDKEDYGDMIKVLNYSRYNKSLQAFVGEKRAVAQDLLLRRREFGYHSILPTREIYGKIIDEQKAAQNKLYEDLLLEDVKIVREAMECHLDIFIDYSPVSQQEFDSALTPTEKTNGL